MALSTDVLILGSNQRGLWLASELVRLGWSVMWVQVKEANVSKKVPDFTFDEWAFHVGPQSVLKNLQSSAQDFVAQAFRPHRQEMSVQVLTPQGPVELTGPMRSRVLKRYFPKSASILEDFLENCHGVADKADPAKAKRVRRHEILSRPLGERWILEWFSQLPLSRDIDAKQWFSNYSGIPMDPIGEYLLLDDTLTDVSERGISWAERQGVKIKRHAKLADIGDDGSRVTGIELGGTDGFVSCKYLISTLGWDSLHQKTERFSLKLNRKPKEACERYVWVRTGFKLKPFSRPAGALSWFSVVMDPFMPLRGDNVMFLKWRVSEQGDSLTVWVKIPFEELFRRGYLASVHEKIEERLSSVIPRFTKDMIAAVPFEEYFELKNLTHDDVAVVFDEKTMDQSISTRFKNMWYIGPENDKALYLMSGLNAETELLATLSAIRSKELKRDRKVHTPRNGPAVDANQTV